MTLSAPNLSPGSPVLPAPGVPAPKVALLPDALFFVRVVPIAATATPAEAAAQVELALEAISPFPAAQLYHGFFRPPGADHALVFAAYRRRFTREQIETWAGAELVLPTFAALLGSKAEPATTLLLTAPEGLTAVHWTQGPVPATVKFRPLPPEATEADRLAVRDELLRATPGSRQVVELAEPPLAAVGDGGDEFLFHAGDRESRLDAALAATMDVRDKAELSALRRGRARDLVLWRVFLGCAAAVVLVGLGAAALYGAGFWQRTRELKVTAQQPVVDQIMTAQSLSTRINKLSTERLLPMEMISLVTMHKPASIQFNSTQTDGLYTLKADAQTLSTNEVATFRSALADLPECEKVEVRVQGSRDNLTTFTLIVTFRPGALKPATSS